MMQACAAKSLSHCNCLAEHLQPVLTLPGRQGLAPPNRPGWPGHSSRSTLLPSGALKQARQRELTAGGGGVRELAGTSACRVARTHHAKNKGSCLGSFLYSQVAANSTVGLLHHEPNFVITRHQRRSTWLSRAGSGCTRCLEPPHLWIKHTQGQHQQHN